MFNSQPNLTFNNTSPSRLLGHAHVLRCSFCLNTYAAKPTVSLSQARCATCSRKFKYIAVLRRLRQWWRACRLRPVDEVFLSGEV